MSGLLFKQIDFSSIIAKHKENEQIEMKEENWTRDKLITQQKESHGAQDNIVNLFTQLSGKFQNNWIEVARLTTISSLKYHL